MKSRLAALVLCVLAVSTSAGAVDVQTPPGWTEVSRSADMVLFSKENESLHTRELLGYTEFDVPPAKVYGLVSDFQQWTKFIPYTKESKILAKLSSTEFITYQLISPPFVSDRDYFLHITLKPASAQTNGVYRTEWTAMPDYQAEREGIVRMRVNEGSWTYSPIAGGTRTLVTYSLVQHPGGSIPTWLANRSTLKLIPTLFSALRARLMAK